MAYNPINPNGQATMANSSPVVIASDQSAIPVSGTVTTTATNLDIRDLLFASDKVDVSGSTGVGVTGTFFQATQPVSATDLDIRNLVFATDKVDVSGSTGVGVTGTFFQATQPVSAVNLDIRDLVFASDKVDVSGSTGVGVTGTFWQATQPVSGTVAATQSGTWILGANSGVDIGDVTINNAAGAAAVNIQDGGNTITVDGTVAISGTVPVSATDLDIRNLVFATDKVDVSGSTGLGITGTVTVTGVATEVTLASLLTSSQLIDDTIIVLGTDTYTEAASKGQIIAAVRRDADTTLVNTTNEYGPLQMDANGRLKVEVFSGETLPISGTVAATQSGTWNITNISGTVSLPTGASTLAEQQTQTTALQLIDNTIVVLGTATYTEASSSGSVLAAVRRDADTTLVNTTNEFGPLQMDANGRLKVEAFSGETLPVSLTSTTITGTVAVTQSGTWDEVGINDSGNSITVDAVDLDIRNLVFATDKVDASGTTLGANSGIDIGDVTINNAAGASAVNIQDGGNTITVDGTVAATQSGTWNITDITGTISLPTGAATSANQTTMITSLNLLDDVIFNDNGNFVDNSSRVSVVGYYFDEVAGTALTENDVAAARIDSKRAQVFVIEDETTRGRRTTVTAANALKVDGSAVTQPVSGTVNIGTVSSTVTVGQGSIWQTALTDLSGNPVKVRAVGATYSIDTSIVDASGNHITSFGGGTQYTEDVAAAADPVGTVPILVRADSPATVTTTDGDNVAQRGTNYGAAYVTLLDTAGSPVSVGGGTQYTEDAVSAANPIGTMLIGVVDTGKDDVVSGDGDNMAARMSINGELYTLATIATTTESGQSVLFNIGGFEDAFNTVLKDNNGGLLQIAGIGAPPASITGIHAFGFDGVDSHPVLMDASGAVIVAGNANAALDQLPLGGATPLTVAIVDGAGNQITSFGGGTQYTEDVASAADPIGTMLIARRRDALVSEVTTAGDNIALNSTEFGELYVKDNTGNILLSEINDSIQATYAQEDVASAANPIGHSFLGTVDTGNDDTVSNDGDHMVPRMNANGSLYAAIAPQAYPAAFVMQNAATANGNGTTLDVSGYNTAVITIIGASTPDAQIIFEKSVDDTNWHTVVWQDISEGLLGSGAVPVNNAQDAFRINTLGIKSVRARILNYVSGTITANGYRQVVDVPFMTVYATNTTYTDLKTVAQLSQTNESGNTIFQDVGFLDALVTNLWDTNGNELQFAVNASPALTIGIHALGTDGTDARILSTTTTGALRVAGDTGTLDQITTGGATPLTVAIVDAAGTQITSFGGTAYTEDIASAADPVGGMMMGVVDTGNNDTVTADGDNMAARMNANGALYSSQSAQAWPAGVLMQNAAAANGNGTLMDVSGYNTAVLGILGASAPSLTVNFEGSLDDSTWFSIQSQSITTGLIAGTNVSPSASFLPFRLNTHGLKSIRARVSSYISGNVTVTGYRQAVGDAFTNAVIQNTSISNPLSVQIDGGLGVLSGVVDETGTNAINALGVGGGTPHDSVDSGNPIKVGAKAIAHGANPTAVAAADRTDLYSNRHGIPFTIGGHPNIVSAEYFTSGAITDDNILPTIAGGTKYVIVSITVACSAANATSPAVRIGFGTSTLTAQGATNADAVTKIILSHPGIPAGSGIVKGNGAGIVGIGGDGEELRITCTTPTTSMTVQVDYYTIES